MPESLPPPTPRSSARALVLDSSLRLLLLRFHPPGAGPFWLTPGGGLEEEEPWEDALRRELREEVGLEIGAIGPCVWLRDHTFPFRGGRVRQKERYFLVRCEPFEVRPQLSEDALRAEGVMGHRWWTMDELAATREVLVPGRLASLLASLLRDGAPSVPFDCGV